MTPDNVSSTICRRGYAASVRPSREVSHQLKIQVARNYGMGQVPFSTIELDHLIPLSLGGSSAVSNLWPQRRRGPHNAEDKDAIGERLHALVCSGRLALREGQRAIATNWETAA